MSSTPLRLRTSTHAGMTWSSPLFLSNANWGARSQIVVDGDTTYVSYSAFSDSVWSVGYKRSHDRGRTWSRRIAIAKGRVEGLDMTAKDGNLDAVFGRSTRRWWDFSTRY